MGRAEEASASELPARLILGTAGHIDHGKTALVQALTGVDLDRLPEEKARGITIELGFTPLSLSPDLRLGVVDVPGHEGLVRTMVAGASGIDVLLLVVAADEGVMPQTREHVAICDLLGIERAVVALTKIDTVDDEVAELAEQEVRELLAGTHLSNAAIVRTSAVTQQGLPELRAALETLCGAAPAQAPSSGPARLPVDRIFAAHGFGAVVTGSLIGAPLRVGDAVQVLPAGLSARIRGLQHHGAAVEAVDPGARCAVNLQGVELSALARGDVISSPDALAPTRVIDVRVSWLDGSPTVEHEGVSIDFLTGTAERVGRLAPIGSEGLVAGRQGFARIHLEGAPIPVLPGDRFVVRGFARRELFGATRGGGVILDVAPPHRRRSDPDLVLELERLEARDPETDVRVRVERGGFAGVTRGDLLRQTGLLGDRLDALFQQLNAAETLAAAGDRWLGASAIGELEGRLTRAVTAFHDREPLRPGMPRAALRGALPENAAPEALDLLLHRLIQRGIVESEAEIVRLPQHRPRLSPEEDKLVERIRTIGRAAALEPPTFREWSEKLEIAPDRVRALLVHLEQTGDLTRAPGDFWFDRGVIDQLRERVVERIRSDGPLDTPSYKRLIGTSRKHAVPLMELFDAEHVTLRRGDVRLLRPGRESTAG